MDTTLQAGSTSAFPTRGAGVVGRGLRRAWVLISAAGAAALGLLPHVLHHAGPLAGAALFAGVGGSLLFGAIGLVAAIPFLIRLHRRFGSWHVPAATLALFAAVFSISTVVVGPLINGGGSDDSTSKTERSSPTPAAGGDAHEQHH